MGNSTLGEVIIVACDVLVQRVQESREQQKLIKHLRLVVVLVLKREELNEPWTTFSVH